MANTIGVQQKGISSVSPAFKQSYIQSIVVENAVTAITHGIGRVPNGFLVVDLKSASGAVRSAADVSAWTSAKAYLISTKAATSAKVLWL